MTTLQELSAGCLQPMPCQLLMHGSPMSHEVRFTHRLPPPVALYRSTSADTEAAGAGAQLACRRTVDTFEKQLLSNQEAGYSAVRWPGTSPVR